MTTIREALEAASNAGVPVVWPESIEYHSPSKRLWVQGHTLLCPQAEADLAVAVIKRGLVAREMVVEVMYMPNGAAHVEIHRDGMRTIMETAVNELAALTAAMRGISPQVTATDGR